MKQEIVRLTYFTLQELTIFGSSTVFYELYQSKVFGKYSEGFLILAALTLILAFANPFIFTIRNYRRELRLRKEVQNGKAQKEVKDAEKPRT